MYLKIKLNINKKNPVFEADYQPAISHSTQNILFKIISVMLQSCLLAQGGLQEVMLRASNNFPILEAICCVFS